MRKTVRGLRDVIGPPHSNDEDFGNSRVELGALGMEKTTLPHLSCFDRFLREKFVLKFG